MSGPAIERRRTPLQRVRLAAEIVLAYGITRRALSRAPITVVVRELRGQEPRLQPAPETQPAPTQDRLSEARGLGRAVTRTLALVPGDTRCLAQALVLTRLLATRGIPAKLVIGTRTTPGFFAHAWVEHIGQPVLSTGGGLFDRLVEL